ncbi:hypothetical protein TSAR_001154, partial [Trichomalopsis sarcophagae]
MVNLLPGKEGTIWPRIIFALKKESRLTESVRNIIIRAYLFSRSLSSSTGVRISYGILSSDHRHNKDSRIKERYMDIDSNQTRNMDRDYNAGRVLKDRSLKYETSADSYYT